MSDNPTYSSVLSNRGFRFLWFNQILVQLAYNTLNFALILWVFKLTDTNLALSALMLAIFIPNVLFGMFAGVFVDIFDRRKIIILIDLFLIIAFVIFLFVKHSFPLILLNTFLVNSLATFFMPSESSSIPMLIPKKLLFLANSLFSLTLYGSFMLGFTIGGPVLNNWGINALFMMGILMMILALFTATRLPKIKSERRDEKYQNLLSFDGVGRLAKLVTEESREALMFIKGKLTISVSIGLLSVVQGIVGILAVMLPSYLERILKIHATDSSYFVMLPLGLGMVSGAFLMGRVFHRIPRRSLVIPAVIGVGILFILVGTVPTIADYLKSSELTQNISRPRYFFRAPSLVSFFALGAFILGLLTVSIIIPCQTVLQESANQKNRGKIFAVLSVFMTAFSAIPVLLSGFLSDLFGVTPIFLGLGVLILAGGLLALRPNLFFPQAYLPIKLKEFLGLGHWQENFNTKG
ncbi:MAG: MFS transporter [Candidatus Daviesbacteria bacterium]|nr:MFS transporter [Candidatus Daviesbacteria bacterium]